jgi:hypothetical protein
MKLASRLRFVQRCDAPPMRCGDAPPMWPRRRRCNRAETGAETGAETSAACAQDRFKIDAEFRQNTDKIQTSYMQIQTCMYVLVSIPKMQTSYRLNRNTILFRWNPHTYTFKHIHAHSVLSVLDTDMYVSNTDMYVWCMYVYVFFCTYIQDKSVTMLSVCAQKYIQIQTCRFPDGSLWLRQ